MARQIYCDFGDCQEWLTKAHVTVTTHYGNGDQDEHKRFCCKLHAALWLIDRAQHAREHDPMLMADEEEK